MCEIIIGRTDVEIKGRPKGSYLPIGGADCECGETKSYAIGCVKVGEKRFYFCNEGNCKKIALEKARKLEIALLFGGEPQPIFTEESLLFI